MPDSLIHFPLYIGDTLKKFIEHPTFEERGAWLSVIVALIQHDGKLVDDESIYYKCLCFSDTNKQVLKQMLSKCFKQKNGFFYCDDINLLINKQKQLREKRRIAGKKGGKALKGKENKAKLKQSESESESDIELELKKKGKNFVLPLPKWLPLEDWNDYLEARTKRGKKATNRAKQLVILKLDELRKSGNDPGEVLRESITNGWTGVFKLKQDNQYGTYRKQPSAHDNFTAGIALALAEADNQPEY